jgi:large subunit ribosomal protein L13
LKPNNAPESIGGNKYKMQKQTTMATPSTIKHDWYVVDAAGLSLGRLAVKIATMITGKHKPTFTPHLDCGDNIIVLNAKLLKFTGKKLQQKNYYNVSQYLGGLRTRNTKTMLENYTGELVKRVVWGMIHKGPLGRVQIKHLFVYEGDSHPHAAQNPQVLVVEK